MIAAVIIAIGLAALGLSFVADRLANNYAERARNWPRTKGQVVGVDLVSLSQGTYTPRVSYAYEVDGKAYANDRRRPSGSPYFYRQAKARERLEGFAVGGPVTVHYQPGNPKRSAIEIEPFSVAVPLLRILAAILLIGGVIGLL